MIQIVEDKSKKTLDERKEEFAKELKKKTKTDTKDFARQLATRERLERDFKEDKILVSFQSSPETRRTIEARKPNQKEFLKILNLSIQASKFEGKGDPESLEELGKIYSSLNGIAADLSLNKTLNKEFWQTSVSFSTLQNFIGELLNKSQSTTGGMTESEMSSFR